MNISSLTYFREVVETKSISKAANISHISQSALSQIIQKLEAELGYQLLNRSNKGVYPTSMGKVVYKYSGTMIRIHNKMKDELHSNKQQLVNVRIDGYSSFINYSLPCIMYKIKNKFPIYKFELHSKSNEESFNDLIDEVSDIGFVSIKPCDDRIKYDVIGKEKIVLVTNSKNKIADEISVDELYRHDMVLLNDSSIMNQFLYKKFKNNNILIDNMNIIFEVDSIAAAKSSIRSNLGLCFLPYMSIKKELYEKEFKVIEIGNFDLDYNTYIISRQDEELLGALSQIVNYFKKNGSKEFC